MRFHLVLICLLFAIATPSSASYQEMQQLIDQEKFAAAASRGETLLSDNPDQSQTVFMTAYAHQRSGQQDRAIELYEKLIADNPTLPEPRNNLAMIHLSRGDYDAASQLLIQAINTHPSYATAYENLSRIYKGIASEAYRRAANESSETAKYIDSIELAAITRLETLGEDPNINSSAEKPSLSETAKYIDSIELAAITRLETLGEDPNINSSAEKPSLSETANQESLLIEQVKDWASAWKNKNFNAYTGFYAADYRGNFPTRNAWSDYQRKQIIRPGSIGIEVDDIQIVWRDDNRANVSFKQAFDSPGYRDRVTKRLVFIRFGSQWKITEERVLSAP